MYLLDTNVVSELRKVRAGKAAPGVARWADGGVLLVERKDAHQGDMLRAWLMEQVQPTFADRILPIDTAVARRSAQLHVPAPAPSATVTSRRPPLSTD